MSGGIEMGSCVLTIAIIALGWIAISVMVEDADKKRPASYSQALNDKK